MNLIIYGIMILNYLLNHLKIYFTSVLFLSTLYTLGQTFTTGTSNWSNVWSQNSDRFDLAEGIGQFSSGSISEGQVDGRFFTVDGTLNGTPRTVKPGQRIRIRIAGQDGGGRTGITTDGIIGISIKSGGGMFDGSGPGGRYDNNSILKIEYVGGQSNARFTDGSGFSTSFMPDFTNFKTGTTYDIEVISDREFNLVIGSNRNNIRSFAGSSSVSPSLIHVRNTGANMDGLFTLLEVSDLPVNLTANDSESFTVSGIISNNESTPNTVNKNGTGIIILTNQNTYTGLTTINAGTLQLNRSGGNTIPTTNDIIVSGGTLRVSSSQTLKDLTINSGGLTVDSGQTLRIDGILTVDAGASLNIIGNLDFGPSSRLVIKGSTNFTTYDKIFPATNGPANFEIDQSGIVTLHATRTLTGEAKVTNGTLAINEGIGLTAASLDNAGSVVLGSTSSSYSSLIVNSITGAGTITYNRYTAQIAPTGTNDLIASPVSGQQFGAFATANDGVLSASGNIRAFAPFNTVTGNYENYDIVNNANTTITPGVGYRAATDSGQTLAFTGTPNNGAVAVTLQDNTSFWNLIGNPYPSYIDIGDFLAENVATTNISASFYGVYGYDGDVTNGWTVWDLNVNQDLLIAPGQGFFVAAPSGGGSGIDFTTAMRRIGTSDDFIAERNTTSDVNFAHAILNLNTASTTYETNVYFRDINTRGLDPGYDTGAFDQNAIGVFTQLVENNNGVNLVNQSLPYNDLNEVTVPLHVNMSQVQTLDFSLDSNTILPPAINVYLEDTVAGIFTLLNNNSYTVTPESALNGTGRFFLRFTSGTLTTGDEMTNSLNIYQDTSAQVLVIEGQLQENTAAYIYDLQGRLVQSTWLEAGQLQHNLKVSSLQTGIYIVKIGQQITHKVMIR